METVTATTQICELVSSCSNVERRISRVPCKARGISDNHTAWNAYIDIPMTAVHGDELVCSNELCASSGRRFRYCAMCALPVAHRNFVKRHGHGMIGPRGQQASAKRAAAMEKVKEGFMEKEQMSGKKPRLCVNRAVEPTITSSNTNIPRMVVIPIVATTADRTDQEVLFLDLMQSRPVDESPELSLWIQKVLDATTSKRVKTLTTSEGVFPGVDAFLDPVADEVESYERDQLQDAVLDDGEQGQVDAHDEGDDCSSIGSAFLNEMVGV